MKHTVTCLVKNQPGALAELTGVFHEKGINIYSLAVSERQESDVSRMTIVVEAEEDQLEQIARVASEVEAVTAIQDLSADELTARELLLLKVRSTPENIPKIMQTAEMFRAEVIAVNKTTLTLAHVSIAQRIDGIIRALRPLGIVELARSGLIAVTNSEAPPPEAETR